MSDVLVGALLFLPVPFVLGLFTRQPFGAWLSLGLGILLMATHRLYARPFALSRAQRRCAWCGVPAGDGPSLAVREPLGETRWRVCSEPHRAALARTLGWASLHRRFLVIGVLGTLGLFLLAAAAIAARLLPRLRMPDAVAFFRLGIALTVLPLGWLAPTRGRADASEQPLPFPLHIQALLGTVWVLWLFRLVGLWWLVAGLVHVADRLR